MIAVTGGRGFVGTNLTNVLTDYRIIEDGDELDLTDCHAVIHLAANADVRDGWSDPYRDHHRNTTATLDLLEAMRNQNVTRLLFASSSAVYGNAPIPTRETWTGKQTSLYGASKLACEALIGAYHEKGYISATILRLTSMLGPHYRHGLVADFTHQAQQHRRIRVLGGGNIARTRMHVEDGVSAFLCRLPHDPGYEIFNVGTDTTITSLEVANVVARRFPGTTVTVEGESWAGDHPILLDCTRLRQTGWMPRWGIEDALHDTIDWLTR